ncbi:MAG: hypothetical protein SAK29_33675, partial [Scytonema sp. PMC 1069.18]|nr:hypothetical protein [Scytonema sp. PMC 1069.18]
MNPVTIEIHEFSTGIRPERTADGGWVSRGFTGKYMNTTLESIPPAVERSIANREFAVTEGASSDRPAIIGRVVRSREEAWSVVALVTRGRDEIGRSLSVYRYFLCQDPNSLWKILAWFDSQSLPTFHPFDTKIVGQPNLYVVSARTASASSPEVESLSLDTPEPLLLTPGQQDDVKVINILAIKKAAMNGQPISWAFNVEALEQPRRFQVIQAASQRAYEILDRVIKNVPQFSAPVVADEEALKSAIRGLINSSQVKPEAVQVINKALENEQISQQYWHSLFDGQGAKAAISQKIYSPQMVRLITLRAMVIPETLPEFLTWLNVKRSKDNADEYQTISLEFQKNIRPQFPKEKLANGVKCLLPQLLNQIIPKEAVYWLLLKSGSAWVYCQEKFNHDIRSDLELIYNYFTNPQQVATSPWESLKFDQEIWQQLINNWHSIYSDNSKVEYYQPLALLLESLKEYLLSAFFYQVSRGLVPKNVFNKVASESNQNSDYISFLTLKREMTWFESTINFLLQEVIVPIQLVIPLSFLFFLSGLFIGSKFFAQPPSLTTAIHRESPGFNDNNNKNRGNQDNNELLPDDGKANISIYPPFDMPLNLKEKATSQEKFEQTTKAMNVIVKEIKKDNPLLK